MREQAVLGVQVYARSYGYFFFGLSGATSGMGRGGFCGETSGMGLGFFCGATSGMGRGAKAGITA